MSEYISREAARKYILDEYPLLQRDRLMRTIDDIPAADVREVVKGGWEEHGEPNERGKYELWYYSCTRCGAVGIPKFNYCPNCGADMRPEPLKEE